MRLLLALAVVLAPATAWPCTYENRTVPTVGPSLWDGRTDVPANWVFVSTGVTQGDGSWWIQAFPDGEWEELEVTFGDGLYRVAPSAPLAPGLRYRVASLPGFGIRPEDVAGPGGLEFVSEGLFRVVDDDDSPPAEPVLLRTESHAVFEPFGDICRAGLVNETALVIVVERDVEVADYHLVRDDYGRVVFSAPPGDSAEVSFIDSTPDAFDIPYTVVAFDLAGHSTELSVTANAGCGGACSSAGGAASPALLAFLVFFCSPSRRCRHRSAPRP